MNVYIAPRTEANIKDFYLQGFSAQEIKDQLQLQLSVRQLQRWIKNWGISRSQPDSFRLAVQRGRVLYNGKPRKKKGALYKLDGE